MPLPTTPDQVQILVDAFKRMTDEDWQRVEERMQRDSRMMRAWCDRCHCTIIEGELCRKSDGTCPLVNYGRQP